MKVFQIKFKIYVDESQVPKEHLSKVNKEEIQNKFLEAFAENNSEGFEAKEIEVEEISQ